MKLSHVQIKVADINKAAEDFRRLGFEVEMGRENATNAFIFFGNDVFIELFSMAPSTEKMAFLLGLYRGRGMKERWKKWSCRKDMLLDFAIEGKTPERADLKNFNKRREEIIRKGIPCSKPVVGSRKPPNKPKTKFGFFAPDIPELPFVVSAYTVNQKPERSNHKNGARRIKWLKVECTPEHGKMIRRLVGDDKQIRLVRGSKTRPVSLCFEGLKGKLDPSLLHGLKVEYEEDK